MKPNTFYRGVSSKLRQSARGRRDGGYAWNGHDFVSISALQKRLIYGKLCESLIAEERHATNSHLPAHAQQDAKEPNV